MGRTGLSLEHCAVLHPLLISGPEVARDGTALQCLRLPRCWTELLSSNKSPPAAVAPSSTPLIPHSPAPSLACTPDVRAAPVQALSTSSTSSSSSYHSGCQPARLLSHFTSFLLIVLFAVRERHQHSRATCLLGTSLRRGSLSIHDGQPSSSRSRLPSPVTTQPSLRPQVSTALELFSLNIGHCSDAPSSSSAPIIALQIQPPASTAQDGESQLIGGSVHASPRPLPIARNPDFEAVLGEILPWKIVAGTVSRKPSSITPAAYQTYKAGHGG